MPRKLLRKRTYLHSLRDILSYIAQDKKSAAIHFEQTLNAKLSLLPENPEIYRTSLYRDDPAYRDMTFMGYTVVYRVTDEAIEVLDIFKWRVPENV